MKIAIITNIIPGYRKAFYERLLRQKDLDITIFCQNHLPDSNIRSVHKSLPCDAVELPFRGSEQRLVWQSLPLARLWRGFDAYVFYGNPRLLSTVIWATLFRYLGKRVILWSQGHTAHAKPLFEKIRLGWWRLFPVILVYTDQEVAALVQRGFKRQHIIGLNNGLDQKAIDAAAAKWDVARLQDRQKKQGLVDRPVILSVARSVPKNRFDLVVEIMPSLLQQYPDLIWCVIGDGERIDALQAMAQSMGVAASIRWLGEIYDEERLAPWFLSSTLLVHPGAIGLTLLHAFGYGLPVVTHDNAVNQMPEFAAFEDGANGVLFAENDPVALSNAVLNLLKDAKHAKIMGKRGLDIARTQYNVDVMVQRFLKATEIASRRLIT